MEANTGVSLASLVEAGEVPAQADQLDREEKEQLAIEGTPFTITDIEYGADEEFGSYWRLKIILEDHPTSFVLGSGKARDPLMEKLQAVVGKQPITNVRLAVTKTRRNQPFYMIAPAE